jgi:hypothetical protein
MLVHRGGIPAFLRRGMDKKEAYSSEDEARRKQEIRVLGTTDHYRVQVSDG